MNVEKSHVVFLTGNAFEENFFKCIISNTSEEDIITAHKEVYKQADGEKLKFNIEYRQVVEDVKLFRKCLDGLDNTTGCFFHKDLLQRIKQLIEKVNSLV